ncbi:hypothetical protein [Aromatoleum bremense]|uniref:hypothetical protein n=1 Tax=Aromatoleum bremense TaxID=76115 RepID=UPI00145F6341|nr:hypothetical protein [Aromatoleum bremense]
MLPEFIAQALRVSMPAIVPSGSGEVKSRPHPDCTSVPALRRDADKKVAAAAACLSGERTNRGRLLQPEQAEHSHHRLESIENHALPGAASRPTAALRFIFSVASNGASIASR